MKSVYALLLILLLLLLGIPLIFIDRIDLRVWSLLTALGTFITSIGVIFVIHQLFIQRNSLSLEQITFLINLSEEFTERDNKFYKAWNVLRVYTHTPKEMSRDDRNNAVWALEKCYDSTLFLVQISHLIENKIIDGYLVYLFYYNKVVNNSTTPFNFLIKWAGTGLDLAANYDCHEIARMIPIVKSLMIKMKGFHEKHDGHGYPHIIEEFDKMEQDFLLNVSKYDLLSDNYINNYIGSRD